MSQKNSFDPRILIGVVIVLVGGLLLMRNLDFLEFTIPSIIFKWQSILIIIGILFVTSSTNRSTGFILIIVGGIGLYPEFWPLVLVLIGLYLLLGRLKPTGKIESEFNKEDFNDVSIFGGGKKHYQSDNFKGGSVTAIFGGSEIDLLNCKLAEGENVLEIFAIFGGTSILAPSDWRIEINTVPIFGGFSDDRRRDPNLVQRDDRVLKVKGLILFGGGEIKN